VWPFLVVLMAAVGLLAAACSSPGAAGPATAAASAGPVKAVVPPGTPAGTQLRWLISAMAHLPLSDAQVRAHFDAAFLAQVSPAMVNQALQSLDALGNAVASGKVHWNQLLTVTAPLKSLPSGELQDEPDGTQISVQDTAAKMISISDNTAANMLINLVGRPAVETALTTTGMADPALDRPFLTTRELFILNCSMKKQSSSSRHNGCRREGRGSTGPDSRPRTAEIRSMPAAVRYR